MTEGAAGLLGGITVLDLCSYLARPYAALCSPISAPMLRQFLSSLAGESRFSWHQPRQTGART
jgi:hypothetical protein